MASSIQDSDRNGSTEQSNVIYSSFYTVDLYSKADFNRICRGALGSIRCPFLEKQASTMPDAVNESDWNIPDNDYHNM